MPAASEVTTGARTRSARAHRVRTAWLKAHRWVALVIGWLVALVGMMGAVLIVARPLDERAHRALLKAQPALAAPQPTPHDVPGAPLESVRRRLQAEFGAAAALTFRPPRTAGEALQVRVNGAWVGTVYLHPDGGREQGRRGDTEGFTHFLFKLHSSLLMEQTGKAMLAFAALAYLVMLLTGIVLWWPRKWSAAAWRIEWRSGGTRALFDLHRVVGAIVGVVIAMSVATGAYMAWRPIGSWITLLGGATPLKAPAMPAARSLPSTPPTLDALVARARRELPDAMVGFVQVPAEADRPLRVRFKLPDEPHPNGISAVTLDPRDGAVLAVQRWTDIDIGARLVAWIYPLHTGELGGPALETLNFISGLSLGTLGVTGTWLWWRRRARGQARPAR
jgi:uncharacterized iron-regulated membrane protein